MKETKKRKSKEKRIKGFAKGMIIYTISLALVFASLISILCAFLYTYEKNLPEKTAEDFLLSLDDEVLASLVKKVAGEMGEFESPELIIANTEHLSGKIDIAKLAKEYTSARPVYRLICGDKDIGKLILCPKDKKTAFGITVFEVDDAFLYPESVPGAIELTSVTVCIPTGASLFVNGKEAGEKYIIEKNVQYSEKTVVTEGTKCNIYKIDDLCLVPKLTAAQDCEYVDLHIKNGKADWFSEERNSYLLTVPSNASVRINGVTPSPSLARQGVLSAALSEFEKSIVDASPKALSYRVYGFYSPSDISVTANGKELMGKQTEDKNEYIYLYSDESRYRVRITAPEDAAVYINGVKVSEKYLVGNGGFEGLTAVKKYAFDKNDTIGVTYKIYGLIYEPTVSAEIDGKEIPLCSLKKNELEITAEFYGKETPEAESAKNAAEEFTKTYFHYVANGAVGIEENYNALISKMKTQSPAYMQIQRSKSSFEFVNQGVYRIDLLEPKNFIDIGGLIYCEVDYSVHLRFYRNEKLYEGTLSLVFIKENASYLVCDMVIDSES